MHRTYSSNIKLVPCTVCFMGEKNLAIPRCLDKSARTQCSHLLQEVSVVGSFLLFPLWSSANCAAISPMRSLTMTYILYIKLPWNIAGKASLVYLIQALQYCWDLPVRR